LVLELDIIARAEHLKEWDAKSWVKEPSVYDSRIEIVSHHSTRKYDLQTATPFNKFRPQ